MHKDHDNHLNDVDYSSIRAVKLLDVPNNFAFAPIFDSKTENAYAIDFISPIGVKSIYRYEYSTQRIFGATVVGEESPSFIVPVEGCDTEFVVGFNGVAKLVRWDRVSEVATVIRTLFTAYGHMNYAMADRAGRLYFGTLNNSLFCSAGADFAMYRYEKGIVTKIVQNIKSSTGMAIDYKRNKFYQVDACNFRIVEFDYDPKTGDICE